MEEKKNGKGRKKRRKEKREGGKKEEGKGRKDESENREEGRKERDPDTRVCPVTNLERKFLTQNTISTRKT